MRWEIKFSIINLFLTESVRNLKPRIQLQGEEGRKFERPNPIYSEYYGAAFWEIVEKLKIFVKL